MRRSRGCGRKTVPSGRKHRSLISDSANGTARAAGTYAGANGHVLCPYDETLKCGFALYSKDVTEKPEKFQ